MSKTIEELYQQAGNQVNQAIPEDWQTAWLQVEMFLDESGGGTAGFYAPKADPGAAKYFKTGYPFYQQWLEIWKFFKANSKQPWTTATFTLHNTGKFDIELGYEDLLATTAAQRREDWVKKHLKGLRVVY